ncbi:MAG: ammonia channel protein, partial [Gammaproteobacteria bacterium]
MPQQRARRPVWVPTLALSLFSGGALAAEGPDGANSAWILTSTALVLFMTLPGLALFYGGLVRSKNVLTVLMQCFSIACVASILWYLVGYSIAFGPGNGFAGGLDRALLVGITEGSLNGTLPESVFVMFQMAFAIITP